MMKPYNSINNFFQSKSHLSPVPVSIPRRLLIAPLPVLLLPPAHDEMGRGAVSATAGAAVGATGAQLPPHQEDERQDQSENRDERE